MGSYATTTSFPQLLSQFYKDNKIKFDEDGATMASKAIERAEGMVNSCLARRYSLPFTTVPPEVIRITEDLASWMIIRASHWQTSGDVKNPYLDDFKEAKDDLKMIAEGKKALADTSGTLIAVNSEGLYKSSTENYTPVFDLDGPKAWAVDPDKITDMANDRAS